jgi:hypothetical protein
MARRLGYRKPQPVGDVVTACYLDSAVPALLDSLVTYDADAQSTNIAATAAATSAATDNDGAAAAASSSAAVTRRDLQRTWRALLSNANAGGENVHRGSCLGALLGASAAVVVVEDDNNNNNNNKNDHSNDDTIWNSSRLVTGLYHHDEIQQEIKALVDALR